MLFSTILFASAFVLGATAVPFPTGPPGAFGSLNSAPSRDCLTDDNAAQIGGLWQELIGDYKKETAEAALVSNYTDYSASALSLNSVCLQAKGPEIKSTDPLFTDRNIFMLAQGSQASIPSKKLNLWHSCDTVSMRYMMCIKGDCSLPVVGVIAIKSVKAPAGNKYPYQIDSTYSEFDSEAWIKNLKKANACVDPASVKKA